MLNVSDKQLVTRAQAGEEAAFDELGERFRERVFNWCYGFIRDTDGAEDVTQEVLIRAWKAIQTLQEGEKFSSWLQRIAMNECKTWIRIKRTRRVSVESLEELADDTEGPEREPPAPTTEPDDIIEVKDYLQRLTDAAKQVLSDRDYSVWWLGIQSRGGDSTEIDAEEIGKELGLKPNHVRAIFRRAERTVFEHLFVNRPDLLGGEETVRGAYHRAREKGALNDREARVFEAAVSDRKSIRGETEILRDACMKVRHFIEI